MIVGCRGRCFRIHTPHGWVFDAEAVPDTQAICPECLRRMTADRKRAYYRMRDRTEQRKATPGGLTHTYTDDAFEGFRNS